MSRKSGAIHREDREFSKILVYDISRWGRFQDTDASAYYEYHCRLHGVAVIYVQEPLACTESPMGSLLKGLKRVMAAEYSRELAIKTRAGQNSALDRGLHMGSLPCMGISRLAVSRRGETRPLGPWEHKAFSREHVRWIRGPAGEVKLVQEIFRRYAYTDVSFATLASQLRAEGRTARNGRPITQWMLQSLLACEALAGNFVWGRWDKGRRRSESEEHFRRFVGALEPIVPREVWNDVQSKRKKRSNQVRTRDQLLAELRHAYSTGVRITGLSLRQYNLAVPSTYAKAFGSLRAAFDLVGVERYARSPEESRVVMHRHECGRKVCASVFFALRAAGIECSWPSENRGSVQLVLGTGSRVRIQAIWRALKNGEPMWHMHKLHGKAFDHVLVARHGADDEVCDCLLLDRTEYFRHPVWFADGTPPVGFSGYLPPPEVLQLFRTLAPMRSPQVLA